MLSPKMKETYILIDKWNMASNYTQFWILEFLNQRQEIYFQWKIMSRKPIPQKNVFERRHFLIQGIQHKRMPSKGIYTNKYK